MQFFSKQITSNLTHLLHSFSGVQNIKISSCFKAKAGNKKLFLAGNTAITTVFEKKPAF